MADPKPSRGSQRLDALGTALEQKLENETGVLDLLLSAHARGQDVDALWDKLHGAAQRDDRLAELAFAYERFTAEKRIKTMAAAAQAKLLHRAGLFFADVFGDAGGAEGYLERALALVPSDAAVFEKLESLLVARQDGLRLSELYAGAATHRATKDEQLELLRRAAELVDGFSGAQERALKLYQDILRLEPRDASARARLAERFASAGRHQDLARLLEQSLLAGAADDERSAFAIRDQLVGLYANKLGEIERALPHVEEILRVDPVHKLARDVAEKLLSHKAIAARVAALLDAVHERLGHPIEAARMLGIQIDQLRGPKRVEAQKRLALLHTKYPGELGDRAKALGLHEQIVLVDPGDEPVRKRYLALAAELDKRLDATRVLSRASNGSKDPSTRARIGVEVGELFLALGDPKKARIAFSGVLEHGGDDEAVLAAARAMDRITAEMKDRAGNAAVLARLADLEPDDEARIDVTCRLAALA
ncbi:MAG TPA: hypothetical protein VHB21_07115, partial [Minicystis sp.]|nr:hypothetical protein [Minicystis sp.]